MIVSDASLIIALLHETDPHHAVARDLVRDVMTDGLVHPITLAEVLVAAARRGVAAEVLSDLEELGFRADVPDAGQPVRLAELRVDTGLKLPDCCVLDVALAQHAPLATFDDRLATVAEARDLQVLPTR